MKSRPSSGVIEPSFIDAVTHDSRLRTSFFGVVLHVVEHFVDSFALDNLVNLIAVFVYADMHGISVAKEIVHVAENFLISAYKEDTDVVWLAGLEGVYGKCRRGAAGRYEIGDFTVAVAGDVLNGAGAGRFLVESGYRDYGENLVDCP